MGEPVEVSAAARAKTRELAKAIVKSVIDDAPMPLGFEWPRSNDMSCPDCPVDSVESLVMDLAMEIVTLTSERDAYAETYNLACRMQDAEQCEDHVTGDDCEQGEVEHMFYEHLANVRTDDGRTDPIDRGEKKRGPAVASTHEHVLNDHDDCVSWCPACRENTSRGLNPDGTAKAK